MPRVAQRHGQGKQRRCALLRHAAAGAVPLCAVMPTASAQASVDGCAAAPGAFRLNGTVQAEPCPTTQVMSVAAAGDLRLFACGWHGATVCDGDGSGTVLPADCKHVGFLGCTTYIADIAVSSTLSMVYAACNNSVTVCDLDATAGAVSNCAPLDGVQCPILLQYSGRQHGVALFPGDDSRLVVACKGVFFSGASGIIECPLPAGGRTLAGNCTGALAVPCEVQQGLITDNNHNAISFDSSGRLIVSCLSDGYAFCDWTTGKRPTGCRRIGVGNGTLCPSKIGGIAELPSGRTAAACHNQGYRLCGTARPSVSPTRLPSVAPTAGPSAAPTASPTRAPTRAPSGIPTLTPLPPSGPPAAPIAFPTLRPTAAPQPPSGPPAAPTAAGLVPGASSAPPVTTSQPSEPARGAQQCPALHPCRAMRCRRQGACRGAGRCISGPRGNASCVAGSPSADGSPCKGGAGSCVAGFCAVLPAACSRSAGCAAPAPCRAAVCPDGPRSCVLRNADEGQLCDDGDPGTPYDTCRRGVCVGRVLCQAGRCEARPCRGEPRCRPTDGICEDHPLPDGTPCSGPLSRSELNSSCVAGSCSSFVAMRFAGIALRGPGGELLTAASVIAPETPLSAARVACAAADGGAADWADHRVALLGSADAGAIGRPLVLSRLSGRSFGAVVFIFQRPVALSTLSITDSPGNLAQAPTRVRVAGCVPEPSAARLRQLGAMCGSNATQDTALAAHSALLGDVRWAALPLGTTTTESGASRSFAVVGPHGPYCCYRVTPEELGGCGAGGCTAPSGLLHWARSNKGLTALIAVAIAGLLLGALMGYRFGHPDNTDQPPPLAGAGPDRVLQQCRDACEVLAECWRMVDKGTLAELAARMKAPEGIAAEVRLFAMLGQPWRAALDARSQLAELPDTVLLCLRLYSQDPQDVDREMGWADAPPPTIDSAGHGLPTRHDPDSWARYKASTEGARNDSPYRVPNRACFCLCGQPRPSSLAPHSHCLRYLAALSWAASACRPDAAYGPPESSFELVRMLGSLPATTRAGYDALRPGHCFALPCLSSCTAAVLAPGDFMGSYPGYAVVLRLRFSPEFATGVEMAPISMYPAEREVLLPPFTVFRVRSVRRPRRLSGEVALPAAAGAAAWLRRLLLHARAFVRPLLVVAAEAVGPLARLDTVAAEWHAEVARDFGQRGEAVRAVETTAHEPLSLGARYSVL